MFATRLDQTPQAITTYSASIRPLVVTTAVTLDMPTASSVVSISKTSVLAKTLRLPASWALCLICVPVSKESTTETLGV